MTEREKLERQLSKLAEEKHSLKQKIGVMSSMPKYAPEFSAARLDAWLKDYERLCDREDQLRGRLLELVCR